MRRRTSFSLLTIGISAALLLSGCAGEVDPKVARDSLAEVTEDPETPPSAAEELDAEAHPEPVVEPLECSRYLVLTARGTGEPAKGQLVSPVARSITKALPDEVDTEDIDYPAGTDVKEGSTRGVRVLIDTLNVQAKACPTQRFILLGYSQGALVIGDALADPDSRMVGATVGQVSEPAAGRVLAIVMFGDPRFVGTEAYNSGTYDSTLNGILPRPESSLSQYEDKIRDFCVAGDFVCQSSLSGVDETPHTEYYDNGMQELGADFVIDQLAPPKRDLPKSQTDRD